VRSDDLAPVAYFGGRCNDAIGSCRSVCGWVVLGWVTVAPALLWLSLHAPSQNSEAWACLASGALLAFRPVAWRFTSATLAQGRYESPLLSQSDPFRGSRPVPALRGFRVWRRGCSGLGWAWPEPSPGCSWRSCSDRPVVWAIPAIGRAMRPARRGSLARESGLLAASHRVGQPLAALVRADCAQPGCTP
jgi:hypothetical protein